MSRYLSNNSFIKRIKTVTNDEYVPLSDYESSSKKVLIFHKKCGNHYEVTPNNFFKGRRCPYCAGKIVIPNKTSLLASNSEILKEWDYQKNTITPDKISTNSNKKVWWTCSKSHSWLATPNSRTRGVGCPYCYKKEKLSYSSLNDKDIIDYIAQYKIKAIPDYRIEECKAVRPVPFSLAILDNDKLLGLIDYRNKYYSSISKKVKEDYCKKNKIPYYSITLNTNRIDEDTLNKIKLWIKTIIRGE